MTTQRIWQSVRGETGLTDVLITIYDSAGTASVTDQSMTELDATGVYYYDFTLPTSGRYLCKVTSSSIGFLATQEVYLAESGAATLYTPTSGAYCEVTDVQEEMQAETAFSASTRPTLATIQKWIYSASDTIIQETGHAWHEVTVTDEYHNIDTNYQYHLRAGVRIKLNHRKIREFSSASGDHLYVWDGSAYVDYLTDKTEGRDNDYWVDYTNGVLYLTSYYQRVFEKPIKLTYRYGETSVPYDIRQACAQMVAERLLNFEDNSFTLADTGDTKQMSYDPRISRLRSSYKAILARHTEVTVF